MKRKYCILFIILLLLLAYSLITKGEPENIGNQTSQNSDQNSPISTDQEIWKVLGTLREFYLVKELKLPEDRAKLLLKKIHDAREIREKYLVRRYQIEKTLDILLAFPNPDQAKLDAVLQELEVAKMEYYQNIMEADHELRTMLSPEEQAKYVLFQRNFSKKLRTIIASIRQQSTKTPPQENFLLRKQEEESVIRQPR